MSYINTYPAPEVNVPVFDSTTGKQNWTVGTSDGKTITVSADKCFHSDVFDEVSYVYFSNLEDDNVVAQFWNPVFWKKVTS